MPVKKITLLTNFSYYTTNFTGQLHEQPHEPTSISIGFQKDILLITKIKLVTDDGNREISRLMRVK